MFDFLLSVDRYFNKQFNDICFGYFVQIEILSRWSCFIEQQLLESMRKLLTNHDNNRISLNIVIIIRHFIVYAFSDVSLLTAFYTESNSMDLCAVDVGYLFIQQILRWKLHIARIRDVNITEINIWTGKQKSW